MRIFQNKLILSLLTGLLLWAGWPPHHGALVALLFIALVPLLLVEDQIARKAPGNSRLQVLGYSYLAFLLWNALSTWWICNASVGGGLFAIIANSFLMAFVFLLFHMTKQQVGKALGYFSLIAYWLAFEYFHMRWELTWPWLTLGNGFAEVPQLIQWYSIVGTLGGSLWMLGVNLLVFRAIRLQGIFKQKQTELPNDKDLRNARFARLVLSGVKLLVIVGGPIVVSLIMFSNYETKGEKVEAVAMQPGIDPYEEKFPSGENFIPYEQQVDRFIRLSDSMITANTAFVVWPETAIPGGIDVSNLLQSRQHKQIQPFLQRNDHVALVTGIDGHEIYEQQNKKPTPTARKGRRNKETFWYDAYNSAILVGQQVDYEYYHKSKLVPGVERMPYPQFFSFLDHLAIDMGGISGSLGTQEGRTVFFNRDSIGAAPVICFESVFGEYVADYINNGASLIFIITNDGWWADTDGYKQHLAYASLRAIETRRSIVRAANTGISCFVDQRGLRHQETKWWEPAVIRGKVAANEEITTFVKYGDLIGRVAILLAILTILYSIASKYTNGFYFRSHKIKR